MTPLARDPAAPQGGAPHINNRQRLDGWLDTKLPLKVVAAVIYSLRAAGRLQFARTGSESETRFNFTIPTPALESAWIEQRRRRA